MQSFLHQVLISFYHQRNNKICYEEQLVMEVADLVSTFRDLLLTVVNHPVYSLLASLILFVVALKFFCRVTLGICYSNQDMTGKTVLITGATAGDFN